MAGERSTNDIGGFAVKQLDQAQDIPLDDTWRHKGGGRASLDGTIDVQSAENRLNRQAVEARRKIQAILESDAPARAPQRPQQPMRVRQNQSGGLTLDDLADGLDFGNMPNQNHSSADFLFEGLEDAARNSAADLYNRQYTGEPDEASMMAEEYGSAPRPTNGDWGVKRFMAELRNGDEVPVWRVHSKSTGMNMEKPFRIQEAAQRIAAVLNQTGNVNHPRVKAIIEAYDTHVSLMKQIRAVRKAISEGQTGKKGRLNALKAQLEEVNYKLGI